MALFSSPESTFTFRSHWFHSACCDTRKGFLRFRFELRTTYISTEIWFSTQQFVSIIYVDSGANWRWWNRRVREPWSSSQPVGGEDGSSLGAFDLTWNKRRHLNFSAPYNRGRPWTQPMRGGRAKSRGPGIPGKIYCAQTEKAIWTIDLFHLLPGHPKNWLHAPPLIRFLKLWDNSSLFSKINKKVTHNCDQLLIWVLWIRHWRKPVWLSDPFKLI